MIEIHDTVMGMLYRTLDPYEFAKVMDEISLVPVVEGEDPFMTYDFSDGDAILDDVPHPPDTYRWN